MEKSCDNCGKYNDCRNGSGTWSCNNNSAWEEKETQIDHCQQVADLNAQVAKQAKMIESRAEETKQLFAIKKSIEAECTKYRESSNEKGIIVRQQNVKINKLKAQVALLADGYSKWLRMYNSVKSESDLGVIEMTPSELIEQATEQIAETIAKESE